MKIYTRKEIIEFALAVLLMLVIGFLFSLCSEKDSDALNEMRIYHEERVLQDYPGENVNIILFE